MTVELTTTHVAGLMRERGYEVHAGPERAISGGAADSRLAKPGDLFTAFRGEQHDGNAFVQQALENGAVAAICERMPANAPEDKTIVIAPDAARAVSELASDWRTECGVTVVGITGTVGKTTTKDLVAATLSQHYATHRSPGNFNSREGLPLAIMSLRRDHEVSILEMAMDSPGEIAELCAIARPDVGIVTNIGLTHVSKLGSIDAIQQEKLSLPRALSTSGTAILNIDDTRIAPVVPELRCRVIGFGAHHDAQLRHGPVSDHGLAGTTFTVHHGGDTAAVRLSLPGAHVVPAAMAAIGCCLAMGMALDVAAESVSNAEVDGRIRLVPTSAGATIIDDRYNSSPASLEGALRLLGGLEGQRIAVIGEMAELGEHGQAEHRRIGEIAAATCDALFASGPLGEPMVAAARTAGLVNAHHFASKEDAAQAANAIIRAGDHILVKASRGQAFETIIPMLGGRRVINALISANVAFVLSLALGWPIVRYLRGSSRGGKSISVDQPESHQVKAGTPTFGGFIIWVPTFIVTAVAVDWWEHRSILLPLGIIGATGAIGFIDDLGTLQSRVAAGLSKGLSWRFKVAFTSVLAVGAAWALYYQIEVESLNVPWAGQYELGPVYMLIAFAVIVGTTSAVAVTDGLDTLAGGTTLFAFVAYGVIAFVQGQDFVATFAFIIAGANLGFLFYNSHPAMIFMGDTGALALGSSLAVVALMTGHWLLLPLIGIVFVAEAFSNIVQIGYYKLSGGKRILLRAPLHHHFEEMGWTETQVVTRFWIVGIAAAMLGVAFALAVPA